MDDALRATARQVRAAMPCSVELPAGTGKTQLVAALTTVAAESGERALILTHTNAGVDALRRRLKRFGVSPAAARVDTMASWSFALARHYPVLSGVSIGEVPRWSRSSEYYLGAAAAGGAAAIRRMLQASYDFVVVDEYQDCVVEQNALVVMLHAVLPVCVLGDPLQNIFNFGKNVVIRWGVDVLPNWPKIEVDIEPWRWKGHNESLGRWLLDIRDDLCAGRPIDLATAPLTWKQASHPLVGVRACLDWAGVDGSVVAIDRWEQGCASVASRTNGAFSMMEKLEGRFMLRFAAVVDSGKPELVAAQTLEFAKDCIVGVAAKLNSYVAKTLAEGKPVAHLKREGAEESLRLLSRLLTDPSRAVVPEALLSMSRLPGVRPFRWEAWRDTLQALAVVSTGNEVSVADALARTRYLTRLVGRVPERRVISRPLLIKGLEFDHVVVLNAEQYSATELYVALTRGRKSLAVVSASRHLRPAAPAL